MICILIHDQRINVVCRVKFSVVAIKEEELMVSNQETNYSDSKYNIGGMAARGS